MNAPSPEFKRPGVPGICALMLGVAGVAAALAWAARRVSPSRGRVDDPCRRGWAARGVRRERRPSHRHLGPTGRRHRRHRRPHAAS